MMSMISAITSTAIRPQWAAVSGASSGGETTMSCDAASCSAMFLGQQAVSGDPQARRRSPPCRAIMSQPIGIPERMKWLCRPIQNIGSVQQHAAGHRDDAEDERPQPAPVGKVLALRSWSRPSTSHDAEHSIAARRVTPCINLSPKPAITSHRRNGCGGESGVLTAQSISGIRRRIHAAAQCEVRGPTRLKLE